MRSRRIFPLLLLQGKRLLKGVHFTNFVDVGDPVSQAMIYDAQGAEEIVLVDIDASREKRIMDTTIISNIIKHCRLPIGAGGGIKTLEDARAYFQAGADKIIVNTHALLNLNLVKDLAREFGTQSVCVSIDVKKNSHNDYDVYIFSGNQKLDCDFEVLLTRLVNSGAGEIIITSIDREGTLSGFDYRLYKIARQLVSVPLHGSGGAGCYDDLVKLFTLTHCDGCALGTMLFLRDYDIVRIKSYLKGQHISVREA